MDFRTAVLVFLGGGTGAVFRVWLSGSLETLCMSRFPHAGTLMVNLMGCFLIGVAFAALNEGSLRTAVAGGFLGGFTTYSAFALLNLHLAEQSKWPTFIAQIGLHLFGGLLFVWLGSRLVRIFS